MEEIHLEGMAEQILLELLTIIKREKSQRLEIDRLVIKVESLNNSLREYQAISNDEIHDYKTMSEYLMKGYTFDQFHKEFFPARNKRGVYEIHRKALRLAQKKKKSNIQ